VPPGIPRGSRLFTDSRFSYGVDDSFAERESPDATLESVGRFAGYAGKR
jgi:hypothetical protein